jgi:hypothetical protein
MTNLHSHRRSGSKLRIALLSALLSISVTHRGAAQEERVFKPRSRCGTRTTQR